MFKISEATKSAVLKKTKNIATGVLIYGLLILLVYVIIFPFIAKISASFMSWNDMFDRTVTLIPREPTLENYASVIRVTGYVKALGGSLLVSTIAAFAQTFVCAMTGYALAKLKGKLAAIVMFIVILTILIPPQVILVPLFLKFRFFDILGVFNLLTGRTLNLIDSVAPMTVLSVAGLGLKNGLFIFVMRQFFKGVPEELEEAALIDGYGIFRSYLRIVLPISIPMLITIFILSFSWQWTDTFYSSIFFSSFPVVARTTFIMPSLGGAHETAYHANTLLHTGALMAIAPIIVLFVVAQKWLVTGIERSGIVG
jgi:multiple sugar transport system permease protein